MDRDKLNKAAEEAAEKYINASDAFCNEVFDGFIQGANWLMQQPLSERLTDEEKKWIKERYNYYMSEESNCYLGSRMRNEYELIGADLFKEK